MSNHALPTLTSTYSNFLSELSARIDDSLKQSYSANVTLTSPPTYTVRWNSASTKWEYNSGTPATPAWTDLATTYAINVSTATTLQTGRTIGCTGDATGTSGTFNGSANISFGLTLATVNSNVGSYGSTSAVPVITVNGKGLITAVSTAALGTIATQNSNAVSISGGTVTGVTVISPVLTLTGSAAPTPTVEGRVEWDTDDDALVVGTGSTSVRFISGTASTNNAIAMAIALG